MNKKFSFYVLVFFFVLIGFNCTDVFAASLSIDEGDYQLECIYNGVTLTIAKSGVYMINNSIEVSNNSQMIKQAKFYLNPNQSPMRDNSGSVIQTFYDNVADKNGGCPSKLYLMSEEVKIEKEKVKYYYIATTDYFELKDFVGPFPSGNSLKELNHEENVIITLRSEQIQMTTSKETLICDYATSDGNSVSIYGYDNIMLLESAEKITILEKNVFGSDEFSISSIGLDNMGCPAHLTADEKKGNNPNQRYLFVNNPYSKDVIGRVDSTYNNVRFYAFESVNKSLVNVVNRTCKLSNNNQECVKYEYIGSRNSSSVTQKDACELFGNNVLEVVLRILGWLQILVPVLVIALTALDIVRMVLSGNIEEELPKKKKTIIIRIIVMIIFFFIPLIAKLLSVLIYGEDLTKCLYSYENNNTVNNNNVDVGNNSGSSGSSSSNVNTTTLNKKS